MSQFRSVTYLVQHVMQRLAMLVCVSAAIALCLATFMAAIGQWSWISLPLQYRGETIENAGMYAQIALTLLALSQCFFLPSTNRVLQLENSHRKFSIGMQDVARAYATAHAVDRKGLFQLSSEFDSVRERLAYLRDHPDLSNLEPAVLEIAAQMSHISKELAEVYSEERIVRARSFLQQRQEEVETFNERLDHAKAVATEMKQWLHEVELEESVAAAQLARLREEMREIMPELGRESVVKTDPEPAASRDNRDNIIIGMPPKAAE
ncbi:DNA repair protein [Sulfitobacter aestuarii]|uniref:DNA repair protein n=1 Tax=Sulfitobacter aestuarii TaxID=2161676 RepID=A0ABW5TYR5_9RHOB